MFKKEVLDEIKLYLTKDSVAVFLTSIEYEVNRSYKFKLRAEESTASASIRADGYIVDFGGSFRGDLFSLLQEYHSMSFPQAVEYVAVSFGVNYE